MKIIVCSSAYEPRIEAHKWLRHYDTHWVVDDRHAADRIRHFCGGKIHVCNNPADGMDRIGYAREWAEKNLTSPGEWYATVDDNVRGLTQLPKPYYLRERLDFDGDDWQINFRELFETPCADPMVLWAELIAKCEQQGTVFGGFAIETNFFFRKIKWQSVGYVRTSCAVVKNVGLPFHYWKGNMLEDFTRSVDVVARYGSVAINRFAKPIKDFFQEGGIGSFEQRKPALIEVNKRLMEQYPDLLRPVKDHDYQLTFTKRGKSLDEWRRKAGFLK